MADYYPVLKRAISSLPSGSGEARRAVYEKARVALLRQLSSYNPPLSPTEIADQRVALEDCIRRVEAEVAGEPAPAPVEAAPPPPPAPAPKAEPAPQPVPEPQPQREPPPQREPRVSLGHDDAPPPFRKSVPAALTAPEMNPFRHIEPLAGRSEGQSRADSPFHDEAHDASPAPVQVDRPRLPTARLPDEHNEPRIGVGVSALTRTLKQADALGAASSTAVRVARNAMDEQGDAAPRVEPDLGGERVAPRQIPLNVTKAEKIEPVRAPREGATLPWAEEATRSTSPLKMILAGLAVVLVLAIGGTAFVFRDALSSLIAGQPDTEASAKPAEGGDGLAPKILDRLPAEGDVAAAPVAPDAKTVQTEAVSPATTVDPDLPPPPGNGATGTNLADATPPPSATADAPPALGLAPTTPSTAGTPAAEQTIGIAQKAILYEEPIPGAPGTKLEGTVVWSFVNEPTLPGEKPVPQIRGEIEVPDLSLKMRLSIHKNDDQALPASHIVEFAFDVPASFPGKFIDTTPGMIAKQTEEARGDPIVGAVAKVSDSLFWLALSGLDQDVARNIQLLKDRAWIDIPIRYGNRRRAILTFEKGAPGDKAFADAFAAWGQ